MRMAIWLIGFLTIAAFIAMPDTRAGGDKKDEGKKSPDSGWTTDFVIEKGELVSTGRNPYFVLEPGFQRVLESKNERFVNTVLHETKVIAGVETRIVEEHETKDGKVIEISRNYYAISKRTNSVFYFGEDVDIYKNGKIVSHDGSWIVGVKDAKFGLMMPGVPLLGSKYFQEIAPTQAMDRAQIVSMTETIKTPAGEFKNCLKIEETTPLEPGTIGYKYYAPGIGMVRDGAARLVKYGMVEKAK